MLEKYLNSSTTSGKFLDMIWHPMNSKTYLEISKMFLNNLDK
jgi:hypothetical protein